MRRFASAALVCLVVAACSGPSGPQPAELVDIKKPQKVRELWSSSIGSAERLTFIPAVAGDAVYAAARDGAVSRFDAKTGAERWRVELDRKLSGGVGADADLVVVVSDKGEVMALEPQNGKVRWRARVSSEVLTPPALGAGLVLVRSVDNRVFAFGAADGARRWVYQRAPASLIVRAPAGMVVSGELAYAGFPGGRLAAIALSNGAVRWEAAVMVAKGATELERVADLMGEPALAAREICAAAYRGRVACYDAGTGRQLWARDLISMSGVSVDARYVFVADERGAVHALDRTNGQSVWKQDSLAYRQLSAPLAIGDAVAVADFEGYVHFLARDTGAFLARQETDGTAVRAAPVPLPSGSGSGLLVQTQDGGLFAFAR